MTKATWQSSLPLFILVAVCALALGYWFGVDRHQDHAGHHQDSSSIDLSEFMQMTLADTQGEERAVVDVMEQLNLINFWATWCAPCRHEMPVFEAIFQEYREQGFNVIGLTIDEAEPAEQFVQSLGVSYPILMVTDVGWDLLPRFGNDKGLLPYSVLTDRSGRVLEVKLGEIDADLLQKWIEMHLK